MTKTITAILGAILLAATTLANAQPASYTIEPLHSAVVFESRHFGTSTIRAQFRARTGTITIDPAAGTGAAHILIDAASVASGLPKFDENLKNAKFFNVAAYPDISFVATDFRFDGDKVAQISGNLTLVGKSRPVTLNAVHYNCYKSPLLNKQVCGGDFVGTVKRSEWDLNIGIPFTSDETKLLVQIEATRD